MAKWIFAAIVALVLAAGLGARQLSPYFEQFQARAEEGLRERVSAELASHPRSGAFFRKFEELFPEEHRAFVEAAVEMQRGGATAEQGFVFAESYMADFLQRNKDAVVQAEPAALIHMAQAITAMIVALRAENPRLCAAYLRDGSATFAQATSMSPTASRAMIDGSVAMLEAISSGKRQASVYAAITPSEFAEVAGRFEALGGNQAALQAMGDPALLRTISSTELCATGDTLWRAVMQMPGDFVPRFVSISLRS